MPPDVPIACRGLARFGIERPELRPGEEWLDEADDEQIRWMLSLSSAERLQVLQDFVDGVTRLRDGRVG